jgi:predicted GNAT family N-acyltransferase
VSRYLLGRLALGRSLHGQGLVGQLLVDAIETICAAADRTGGRLIVVDPIDDAACDFYRRYGFMSIEKSARLCLLISRARASLVSR